MIPVREKLASPSAAQFTERLKAVSERQVLGGLLSKLRIDCVIDAGANEGQYARLIRRLGFTGLILSFEPNFDVFQKMEHSFAGDHAWRGGNCALGSCE